MGDNKKLCDFIWNKHGNKDRVYSIIKLVCKTIYNLCQCSKKVIYATYCHCKICCLELAF